MGNFGTKDTLLLTGATGKFGRVLLKYFLERGWQVVATSRSRERLDKELSKYQECSGKAWGVVSDLTDKHGAADLVAAIKKSGLSVTHLINNARSLASLAVESDGVTARHNFLDEFELEVVVPYELTMRLADSEHHSLKAVVNIGSQYGLVAPNPALYCHDLSRAPIQYGVSKAGTHHLTRELAVRLAPRGIRVNCVAFGGVEGRADADFVSRYSELSPSRRMLIEQEVPGPVAFLLDDASSAVQGHVLQADGGWSLW